GLDQSAPKAPPGSTANLAGQRPQAWGSRLPAQALKPGPAQRIEKDAFLRHIPLVMAILAPATGSQADLDPVARPIRGPAPLEFRAGLQQPRGDAIAVRPIRHDAPREQAQDVRGQMLDAYGGQDQEAAVAEDP